MRNLAIGLFTLLIFGCSQDKIVYEEIQQIEFEEWSYGDQYEFQFDVVDTSKSYRLLLYLDFSTDYRWQNLYTTITTTFPGDSVISDVVSLEMADKTGMWYGDCNRDRCELNIPLQEQIKFPFDGSYKLSFEQFMREEHIRGLRQIGLKLVEPKS